ncbi:MFS transporter [Bradyrhizobium barranii subsp. barranii]|uniref:MFS transporter n=1 Tax=Bradyrhizobium barranii subsp. barranii TaxID=2823807 RepID=A0A939M2P4_9BRAD|nr:MFS transporter [Bradyrhizobium barranii]UEM14894.1 MFS transporter [Bradyrhizobium barranii subsp. barranii]
MQTPTNRAEKNWVLGVTALASFMMALDAMIITTAFATIRAEFGSPVETLQWTVNAFNLTFAVLLLTGAALGDRFGRRRMFATGIALFVVASAACALAGNATALIAARALGIFASITGCALIIGPAIGGFITEHFGWRWVFWINLPIGLIAIALVLARLRESFGPAAALDIAGLALVALAALALVWSLLRGNAVGWASAEVMGTLMSGLVFTAGFVLWELRAAAPMVPMRLFASRALASGMSASVLFYAAMYGVLFLLPQFLQTTLGFDAFGAGLRLLPWTATLFVTAPIAGAVVNRFGERPLVVTGLLMQAIGLGWIAEIVSPTVAYSAMVAPLVLAGVGVSMAMPAAQNAVLSSVAVAEMGKVSGIFNMGRFLGGMFGIAALVANFSANGGAYSAAHFESGFAAAMRLAAMLSLVGAIAGLFLPARRRTASAAAPQDA